MTIIPEWIESIESSELLTRLTDAVGKLAALGSADQIALFMQQEGITALRGCPTACVVSLWVKQQIPGVKLVSTTTTEVFATTGFATTGYHRVSGLHENARTHLLMPIPEFINLFDGGYYPELVSHE